MDNRPREPVGKSQQGFALMMLVFVLGLVATAIILSAFSPTALKNAREQKSADSLMQAKVALIAYATTRDLSNSACVTDPTSCNRPGELPCPDTNNDGYAEPSCDNQTQRIGRLPYKTLGLDDIRDSSGERLWYAVSNNFKNSTRLFPLNSDTIGSITVKDSQGNVINNGSDITGAVAVIFAPGAALTRSDGVAQARDTANENNPVNYLDSAKTATGMEDNATFTDGSISDGFIMGDTNAGSFNDRLVVITHDDLFPLIEARVVAEASNALQNYYNTNLFYPNPADFNLASCLGAGDIAGCASDPVSTRGRIPANPTTAWDSASILNGNNSGNWFQQNAWREVIYYGVSSTCYEGTTGCLGGGNLTLLNALVTPTSNKKVVLIATGRALASQSRSSNADKTLESNYLEGENLSPDNTYIRTVPLNTTINDFATSIQ